MKESRLFQPGVKLHLAAIKVWALLTVLVAFQVHATPPVNFSSTNFYPRANSEMATVQDFDGDGNPDLAVVSRLPNYLSIYLNTGNGNFGTASNYALPNQPFAITSGDIAGHGKADIAVTIGTTICLFTNYGNGTFSNSANYVVLTNGAYLTSVALGDLNDDHQLDIVAGLQGSNSVAILLNNGAGSFTSPAIFSSGLDPDGHPQIAPTDLKLGDLNNDGILDIATANYPDSGFVSTLMGKGDGTFSNAVIYAGGNPVSLDLGDFHNHGELDIVTASPGLKMTLLPNNGDGTFGAPIINPAVQPPQVIATGDFNGDGNLDVVVGQYLNNPATSIGVYLGNGDGTFASEINFFGRINPTSICVADLNQDGAPDAIITSASGFLIAFNQTLPTLQIRPEGNQVTLQWPNWAGYRLETTTSLLQINNWTTVTNGPTMIKNQNFVTNSLIGSNQFFRLHFIP